LVYFFFGFLQFSSSSSGFSYVSPGFSCCFLLFLFLNVEFFPFDMVKL